MKLFMGFYGIYRLNEIVYGILCYGMLDLNGFLMGFSANLMGDNGMYTFNRDITGYISTSWVTGMGI